MISQRMRKRYTGTTNKGLAEEERRLVDEIARLSLRLEAVRQVQRERVERRAARAAETAAGGAP